MLYMSVTESEDSTRETTQQGESSSIEPPPPVLSDERSPATTASFGDKVCGLKPQDPMKKTGVVNAKELISLDTETQQQVLGKRKTRNIVTAVAAVIVAVLNYAYQYAHPITPIQLLAEMQQSSAPMSLIGTNGKPTVVDFWAPWCENCKLAAPTLKTVEEAYRDKVNFIMVNGDQPQAWPYIEAFRVDAIPHLALVNADGDVETALIGPIPKSVLEADLDVLIQNAASPEVKPLPFRMLDVFANQPEKRRVHFDP